MIHDVRDRRKADFPSMEVDRSSTIRNVSRLDLDLIYLSEINNGKHFMIRSFTRMIYMLLMKFVL